MIFTNVALTDHREEHLFKGLIKTTVRPIATLAQLVKYLVQIIKLTRS